MNEWADYQTICCLNSIVWARTRKNGAWEWPSIDHEGPVPMGTFSGIGEIGDVDTLISAFILPNSTAAFKQDSRRRAVYGGYCREAVNRLLQMTQSQDFNTNWKMATERRDQLCGRERSTRWQLMRLMTSDGINSSRQAVCRLTKQILVDGYWMNPLIKITRMRVHSSHFVLNIDYYSHPSARSNCNVTHPFIYQMLTSNVIDTVVMSLTTWQDTWPWLVKLG